MFQKNAVEKIKTKNIIYNNIFPKIISFVR